MLKKILKKAFYNVFTGVAFPAISSQLKGMKLIVDPLMPNFLFWSNFEIEGHLVYDNFIKDGNVIFDIGGNVGTHSIYFARHFKNTRVFTFEPLPENAAYVRKLITLNKITNIQLEEKAVGTITGSVYFDRDKNNHQGHISSEPSNLSVQVTTLDDFIERNNVLPNFIKIDVEGFEADVLDGYKNKIAGSYPFIIIEIHTMEQSRRVGDFFRPMPYSIYRLVEQKSWALYKPLLYIDNVSVNNQPPAGMWGVILAIPNAVKEQYKHLFN